MSQTNVRTFQAATMQEALDIVRKELGPDAVILHTRELPRPRFFKWRKAKARVEITAGTGVNIRTPKAVSTTADRKFGAAGSAGINGETASRHDEQQSALPPPLLAMPSVGATRFPSSSQSTNPPVDRAFRARPTPVSFQNAPTPVADPQAAAHTKEQQWAITRQLSSIEQMVSQLTRGSLHQVADVPTELFQLYTELIDMEVEEDLARELIQKLKEHSGQGRGPAADDAAGSKSLLRTIVETNILCAPPIVVTPGRRRVVALVGPTGVGKTTTIAKLAANFRLRDGIRMGLVTVDTYRIAAVEQLRTYAEIIDLPMKVVTTPREMRRALDELAGLDLVLIDTAGRSPRDELKIQELKSLLAEAQVDDVHLVLSLAASAKSLQATAEKFSPAGTTSLILTKLDEAIGMGSLLSATRRIPLPVSYLTTGQDVPDDIEHASAKRIARLALGEDSLSGRRRHEEASKVSHV
jgi:flagellar biosynthesis protein FlhF